eukprot:2483135-Prymnesium_polylepis.1
MKEVPVPFAYVQVNAALLLSFNIITPFGIAVFSSPEYADAASDGYSGGASTGTYVAGGGATAVHVFVSVLLTAIVTFGFTAMWMVANEMEDPFGDDANDLDVMHYHTEFCKSLDALLEEPWLEQDHWSCATGDWQPPQENWTAALEIKRSDVGRRSIQYGAPVRHQRSYYSYSGSDMRSEEAEKDGVVPTRDAPTRQSSPSRSRSTSDGPYQKASKRPDGRSNQYLTPLPAVCGTLAKPAVAVAEGVTPSPPPVADGAVPNSGSVGFRDEALSC